MNPEDLITTIEDMTAAQLDRLQNAINAVKVGVPGPTAGDPADIIDFLSDANVSLAPTCTARVMRRDCQEVVRGAAAKASGLVLSMLTLPSGLPPGYGAHSPDGRTFDFWWYRTDGKPDGKSMLNDDGTVSARFDLEKNATFLLEILRRHEACEIQIHSKLRDALTFWVRRNIGSSEAAYLWMNLNPEDTMGHDWHCHIRLKRDRNE